MTLFEFISVAYSLILSFAAVRLLGGAPEAFAPGRRYWVHCVWVCMLMLGVCATWWIFWSYRHAEWNSFRFLLILAAPAITYFQAAALIPSDPAAVSSWRDHYYRSRGRFFGALALGLVIMGIQSYVFLDFPLLHLRRGMNVLMISLLIVAAVSPRESVHRALAVLYALVIVYFFSAFVFDPDSWALQR